MTLLVDRQKPITCWVEEGGKYHIMEEQKLRCNNKHVTPTVVYSYYGDNVCDSCYKIYKNIVDKNTFNVYVFGNERMLRIMMSLSEGSKKMFDMDEIMRECGKTHIFYEMKVLMRNGLVVKDDKYYSLSDKGKIAVFIGDLILSLKDIDEWGVKNILSYLEEVKRVD